MNRARSIMLAGVALCGLAPAASAQTTSPGVAVAAPPTALPDQNAADIVVTANKREQKLNDVGLTVAVVSGTELQNRQINSLADLAQTVPSLSFTYSNNGTPVYTLRGIGFYDSSIGSYPAVSTYVDEIPFSFPVMTTHSAYDLERVEVLKGPQGTLFGQNATGGAINYIAAKPSKTLKAGLNLTYGRFNEVVADGYVSGPLGDRVQARLSGHYERADGWQTSNSRPGDRNGKDEVYSGRLQIAAQPTDGFRLLFRAEGWKEKGETQAPQFIGLNFQNPITDPRLTPASFSPMTDRAADWTPGLPYLDNNLWQTALRAELDVSDNVTLTSLTSYVHYKQDQGEEGDGLPISVLDLPHDRGKITSFSQELHLSNAATNPFRWVVGGNYEKSKTSQYINILFPSASSSTTLGALLGYPIHTAYYGTTQHFRNYAFFGNAEYDIARTITLKAGGRYTNTRDVATGCSRDLSGLPNDVGSFFYNILLGGAYGPYNSSECFPINDLGYAIGGVPNGAPGPFNDSLKEHNISWKGGVDWKPRPGLLVYANVAKGYKAGAFPTVSPSTFDSYLPVKQESVISYEAGFKASLLDRTLQFNAAGFYYDYRDKQLRSKLLALPFGILDVLQNIPKSTVKGFEVEMTARPTRGFVVIGTFTYLNSKIDQFTGINAAGVSANFAGTAIPFTPKYQVGINADYDFPLNGSLNAFLGGGITYRSKADSVVGGEINPPTAIPQNVKLFVLNDYALVDLRAGVRTSDDKWRFSVWGKNVFNAYYFNNVVAAFDTIGRYTGRPATYGASIGYKF